MDEREREFRREKKKLKRKILQGQNEIEDLPTSFSGSEKCSRTTCGRRTGTRNCGARFANWS